MIAGPSHSKKISRSISIAHEKASATHPPGDRLRQSKHRQKIATYSRELVAEFIGTFAIVFAGTGAVIVNTLSEGALTHLGISFVFGAVVAAMIYALGHISDAHFNPAVTLAFWKSGCLHTERVLPYIAAQVLGGVLGSGLLFLSFGNIANMGATLPLNGNWQQSFIWKRR